MKNNDSAGVLLAGLLILCSLVVGIHSGVHEGLIDTNTIILALKVILGFIVVFCASVLIWFAWACFIILREDKEKVKGEEMQK